MAVLKHTLLSVTTKNVLTVAVEGISKLMLMKLIDDQEVDIQITRYQPLNIYLLFFQRTLLWFSIQSFLKKIFLFFEIFNFVSYCWHWFRLTLKVITWEILDYVNVLVTFCPFIVIHLLSIKANLARFGYF